MLSPSAKHDIMMITITMKCIYILRTCSIHIHVLPMKSTGVQIKPGCKNLDSVCKLFDPSFWVQDNYLVTWQLFNLQPVITMPLHCALAYSNVNNMNNSSLVDRTD